MTSAAALAPRLVAAVLLLAPACRSEGADGATWLEPAGPVPDVAGTSARDGTAASFGRLRGRVVMLSFGYTHCADVCPVTMRTMRGVLGRMGRHALEVAPVYVSLDPVRDTAERLRALVQPFDRRIDAWRVPEASLAPALEAFGVAIARRPVSLRRYLQRDIPAPNDYSLDHTGGLWIIDRLGRLRIRYAHGASEEAIASGVRKVLLEGRPPAGA
jgi:protein SCO1/2